MKIYMMNLILCVILSAFAVRIPSVKKNFISNYKANYFCCFIMVISMSVIASIRSWVGTDYGNYKDLYYVAQHSDSWWYGDDKAFNATLKYMSTISSDDQIMFAVYGSLIVFLFILAIREISDHFQMSIFLYITGMFFYNSFNGIRQWFVSGIMLLAYPLFLKKKYKTLVLITFICYFFHSSVIYYALIYMVVSFKPFKKGMACFVALIGAIYVYFDHVSKYILPLLGSKEESYAEMFLQADQGANIMRLLVAALPVIISFVCYRRLRAVRKDIDYLINFSVVNMMLMLLATRHWLFARFTIYFEIYNIFLIPAFIEMFNKRSKKIVYIFVVLLYLLYMYVLLHVDSELLPYRTIYGHKFY